MNFTEEQKIAIEQPPRSSQVIVARAGTGKTTVAAARIQYLIDHNVDPKSIYAITFTRAGGESLRQKIDTPIGWSGTLHSFALWTLGYDASKVLSEDEEEEMLKGIRKDLDLPNISMLEIYRSLMAPRLPIGNMGLIFRTLKNRLESVGKTTFAMVLHQLLDYLKEHDLRYTVVVDEAQDAAPIDSAIYHEIGDPIIAIGDPAQAIYGFRGASPEFLRSMARKNSLVSTPLTASFRCGKRICELASKLLPEGQQLTAFDQEREDVIERYEFSTERAEEDWMLRAAFDLYGSTAILCRYNRDVDRIRRALASDNIPLAPRIGNREADDSEVEGGIVVETIHAAKGREWDNVILAACNEDLDRDTDNQADNRVYVAITRARKRFGMTRAKMTVDPFTGQIKTTKSSKYFWLIS